MPTDQTIEIKLVLRDELSRQLEPVLAKLREIGTSSSGVGQAKDQLQSFGRTVQVVHRELSTLASITLGGLIGGGIAASLMAVGRALGEMANRGLQLHYTADALNVTTGMLNRFSNSMMGLGKSQEEGASAIQSATKSLRELQIEGSQSSLFTELESAGGKTGKKLARELGAEIAGPRGMQGGLELALRRMGGMRSESAAKFAQILGLGPGFGKEAAKDLLEMLGQLPKRLELSPVKMRELAKANAELEISLGNIKVSLASALIPIFADLTKVLDNFLRSQKGQEFLTQIEAWGASLNKAIGDWLKGGGLDEAVKGLGEAISSLISGFKSADEVVKEMGLTWPKVFIGLAAIDFGAKLLGIAAGLAAIARIPEIIALLAAGPAGVAALAALALALTKPSEEDIVKGLREHQESQKSGREWWNKLKEYFGGQESPKAAPQSGEETPKSDMERRADLDVKKRADRELTDEFKALEYDLAKLNDYIMPGGPEGAAGASGFQNEWANDLTPEMFDKRFGGGVFREHYTTMVDAARKHDIPPSMMAAIMGMETGYGKSRAVRDYNNPAGLMVGASKGQKEFQKFATLREGIDKAGEVQKRVYEKGGRSIAGMAKIYAPTGKGGRSVANDPHNTNRLWSGSVANLQMGFQNVGGGMPPITPANIDLGDGGPITTHLASRDRALNGSATVDIDVSGLSSTKRKPADLFRKQPLGGVVQMQNNTRPEINPLSFE